MESFPDESAIALENARLFEEIARKSRELEIASQHKSQFVANMSHELRTPLAAILGFPELIQGGFYQAQAPKPLDAFTGIGPNGNDLLGLINTVLDIAKIESGQFTLNMAEYARERGRDRALGHRVSRAKQEAHPQDRGGEVPSHRAWRRAAPHAGIAKSRRQRHQVHRCG